MKSLVTRILCVCEFTPVFPEHSLTQVLYQRHSFLGNEGVKHTVQLSEDHVLEELVTALF